MVDECCVDMSVSDDCEDDADVDQSAADGVGHTSCKEYVQFDIFVDKAFGRDFDHDLDHIACV